MLSYRVVYSAGWNAAPPTEQDGRVLSSRHDTLGDAFRAAFAAIRDNPNISVAIGRPDGRVVVGPALLREFGRPPSEEDVLH
jgi:hypothetical protein